MTFGGLEMKLTTTLGAAVLALGTAIAAQSALAADLEGSIKDGPMPAPAAREFKLSANVGIASEYVFRGVSQTSQDPAIQGGFDASYGMLYAGVWASNLNWGVVDTHIEMDWYAGIKPVTGPITWDLGVIYYTYPGAFDPGAETNYVELKLGASGTIWRGGTLGGTVFYSPDYSFETGNVWTLEGTFAQELPKFGMFTPTFSATLGYQAGKDASYISLIGNGDDNYLYWNAGLTLGFMEKWALDLRYWDSNLGDNAGGKSFCDGSTNSGHLQCDSRFVASLKFTY